MGEYPEVAFDRVIQVNLKGVFNSMSFAARAMEKAGNGGCIISTSSTTALMGFGSHAAYVAVKGAIVSMTRGLAA